MGCVWLLMALLVLPLMCMMRWQLWGSGWLHAESWGACRQVCIGSAQAWRMGCAWLLLCWPAGLAAAVACVWLLTCLLLVAVSHLSADARLAAFHTTPSVLREPMPASWDCCGSLESNLQ